MFKSFKALKVIIIGFAIILVCMGADFIPAQVNIAKKPPKPPPPVPEEKPLILESKNIVTVGRGRIGGVIQVWGNETLVQDQPIWTYDHSYSAVAIGDVDNDPSTREIVFPSGIKITEGKGKNKSTYAKTFLNVYQEGVSGEWMWKSSYYLKENEGWVIQDSTFAGADIVLGDVDGDGGNEVIMNSDEWLLVFKYVLGNFKIIGSCHKSDLAYLFDKDTILIFNRVVTGNIDDNLGDEIFLNANIVGEDSTCLFAFSFSGTSLDYINHIKTDAQISYSSLCAGDLDGDNDLEICAPGYEKGPDGLYYGYIYVWDYVTNSLVNKTKILTGSSTTAGFTEHLAVGELYANPGTPGEELVFFINEGRELVVYNISNTELPLDSYSLPEDISLGTLNIADFIDIDGNGTNEIVATGTFNGYLYHVVFGLTLNADPIWQYIGTKKGEPTYVWDATVG